MIDCINYCERALVEDDVELGWFDPEDPYDDGAPDDDWRGDRRTTVRY